MIESHRTGQSEWDGELFRLLIGNVRDHAILILDPNRRVVRWSKGAEEIFGYVEAEMLGHSADRIFTPEDQRAEAPLREVAQALATGRGEDDRWHVRKDGSRFWSSGVVNPLRDENGSLKGFIKILRDLTSRKQEEQRQQAWLIERERAEAELTEQTATAETLNRIGSMLAAELDLHKLVQVVTDEGTRLTGAQFGAFFYNVIGARGEAYTLYTLSGVPREAFARFPMPRNTALFGPTFRGEGVVRVDDVTQDGRYGRSEPYFGMPEGHLPVRSYLAIPVTSRDGEVLGGLFFGHSEAGVFTPRHERLLIGIAGQAAVAIDNARLYQRAQSTAERLHLALSAADLGDWNWDAASDVVTFSSRAAEIFGLPTGPHLTWTAMQGMLHPEDRERARQEVDRVIEERGQYDIEYRVRRADGRMVWVSVLGRANYSESGKVQGMFGIVRDVSERKRLEDSLRASEGRFRGLMEQAPFSIQVLSPDGWTVSVNRAWEDLWGLKLEQIADYNILEDPQLEAKGILPYLRRAFAGEPVSIPDIPYNPNETIPDRTRHLNPVRWVSAVAYPLKDTAGIIREIVLVHDDITARMQAEKTLRESEDRFRQLSDAMPQIVWTAGPDGVIDYSNQRWHEFSQSAQGVGNEGWSAIVHPDDMPPARIRWADSVRTGTAFDMELRLFDRRRGVYRWHLLRTVPARNEDGRVIRWYGTATDIDEQKRAAEAAHFLADASASLAAVVDYESTLQKVARLAVPFFADWCVVDLAGENGTPRRLALVHVDQEKVAFVQELQRRYPPHPDDPHGSSKVFRTGQPEMATEIDDSVFVNAARDPEHLELLRKLDLRSYICVPMIARNTILGVLSFVMSDSRRVYRAADLELAQDLANRAAIAIDNARLYHELREVDRRKDQFLATLAHELRNPLAPIRNSLQILKMTRVDEPTGRQIRAMMERQVDHLVRLVDDLLDISRVMRGKIELRKERVELASVVARAVETAQPLIEAQSHRLDISLPSDSLLLDADPVRLAQVVGNLLTNAAKYTDAHGQITLTGERDGNEAVLRVTDNGIGIAAEMLPHIFELFVQVDHASTRSQGGLGIGLTLVRNLVEMHQGTVEAQSAGLGKGSEFVVRLPLVAQDPDDNPAGVRKSETAPLEGTGHRLLVVDDNKDAADSLALLLRLQGHQVKVAHDGASALLIAAAFSPQAVFLDIGMPKMDGYEVARRLRQMPDLPNVILAAMTGWGQLEDRRRSAEAGFDHHFVKPPDPLALEKLLAEIRSKVKA